MKNKHFVERAILKNFVVKSMNTIRINFCFLLKKLNFRVMVLPFSFGIIILLVRPMAHHIVASQAHEFRRIRIRGAEIYGGQVASLLRRA